MALSSPLRLLCLALVSVGVAQPLLSLLFTLLTPVLARASGRLGARGTERALFAIPAGSHAAALLLVAVLLIPGYLRGESNSLPEPVGSLSIAIALAAAARYGWSLVRALRLLRGSGADPQVAATSPSGVPYCISEREAPRLAVSGVLLPRIVVSRAVLHPAAMPPEALEIALAHEWAHVRHRDNLKLLLLASLALPGGSGSVRRWRRAAEIAADEEAVGGSRPRAILLAETVLAEARAASGAARPRPATTLGLVAHEEDLAARISRLLSTGGTARPRLRRAEAALLLLLPALLLAPLLAASLHEVAELLLHLG